MPKRRGRPRLDEESETVSVTIKMPATQYDKTYRCAQAERVTVPELIRRDLREGATKKQP